MFAVFDEVASSGKKVVQGIRLNARDEIDYRVLLRTPRGMAPGGLRTSLVIGFTQGSAVVSRPYPFNRSKQMEVAIPATDIVAARRLIDGKIEHVYVEQAKQKEQGSGDRLPGENHD